MMCGGVIFGAVPDTLKWECALCATETEDFDGHAAKEHREQAIKK